MKNGQNQSSMDLLHLNSKTEIEVELSAAIVAIIRQSIEQFGDARILLSGGSTPFGVYQKLAEADLDWSKVMVGMVDERMVENTDKASNYGNIAQVFDKAIESGALVLPMVTDVADWTKNLYLVSQSYQPFMQRIDFVLLGMGNDGHTASLFPNDSSSEMDLKSDEIALRYTVAPSEPKLRMTCSKGMLRRSRNTALMFVGSDKMQVFESAEKNHFPIHQLLSATTNVKLY